MVSQFRDAPKQSSTRRHPWHIHTRQVTARRRMATAPVLMTSPAGAERQPAAPRTRPAPWRRRGRSSTRRNSTSPSPLTRCSTRRLRSSMKAVPEVRSPQAQKSVTYERPSAAATNRNFQPCLFHAYTVPSVLAVGSRRLSLAAATLASCLSWPRLRQALCGHAQACC